MIHWIRWIKMFTRACLRVYLDGIGIEENAGARCQHNWTRRDERWCERKGGVGGIAISARASGGRGGLSRGITSLATRRLYFQQGGIDRRLNYFVRPAYTWTWPEKTDLHHPLSSSPPPCIRIHTYARTQTLSPWKHVAVGSTVAFCAFSWL